MLDLKGVKNIIFDLGGVILNIDYHLTENAFKKIGISNFDEIYSQAKQNSVFDNFEKGNISSDEFRAYIRSIKNELSDEAINAAWNAMLLTLPINRIDLLKGLKTEFNCFLLSNTNEIHIDAFQKIIKRSFGENIFDSIFIKQYYSSQIGLRKPDANCFEFVLKDNSLNASQTLFIDDSIQHIEGAKKMGLRTYHLQKNQDIISLFPDKFQ